MFLLDSEHIREGALPSVVKLGERRPVTLAQVITVLWNMPSLAQCRDRRLNSGFDIFSLAVAACNGRTLGSQ